MRSTVSSGASQHHPYSIYHLKLLSSTSMLTDDHLLRSVDLNGCTLSLCYRVRRSTLTSTLCPTSHTLRSTRSCVVSLHLLLPVPRRSRRLSLSLTSYNRQRILSRPAAISLLILRLSASVPAWPLSLPRLTFRDQNQVGLSVGRLRRPNPQEALVPHRSRYLLPSVMPPRLF
jgi:hypothetical protein